MKTALKWALLALVLHTLVVPVLLTVGTRTYDGIGYELVRIQESIDAPVRRLVWQTQPWLRPLVRWAVRASGWTVTSISFPVSIFLECFYGGAFYFVVTFLLAGVILLLKRAVKRPRPAQPTENNAPT